jgi:hypothetical protein
MFPEVEPFCRDIPRSKNYIDPNLVNEENINSDGPVSSDMLRSNSVYIVGFSTVL